MRQFLTLHYHLDPKGLGKSDYEDASWNRMALSQPAVKTLEIVSGSPKDNFGRVEARRKVKNETGVRLAQLTQIIETLKQWHGLEDNGRYLSLGICLRE